MGSPKSRRHDRQRRAGVRDDRSSVGLAYTDDVGNIAFDPRREPLGDGGLVRRVTRADVIAAPPGTVATMLPGRTPLLATGKAPMRETTLGALLPAGFTRLLLPAFSARPGAPQLPLFGYTYACVLDDELHVAAMRTDHSADWQPRSFVAGELEGLIAARLRLDGANRTLTQVARCASEYGCFTAQNIFLERGEAALPVSPKCNAACVGCISELASDSAIPAPQTRLAFEPQSAELARLAIHHLERVDEGIVSFGQGCEGEPLLRAPILAAAIEQIRRTRQNGTINLNTNGSLPRALRRLIDAGLQAVRISLNSFRADVYRAYYRPIGYDLHDVLESIALAVRAGLRVSLNYLTHPGVTDERAEIDALTAFVTAYPIAMLQTRTLNIDPDTYFARVGRPTDPLGMRVALARIESLGVLIGNFTHPYATK